MKFRLYLTMELVQKLMKKTYKYLIYIPLTEKILTEMSLYDLNKLLWDIFLFQASCDWKNLFLTN